MSSLLGRTLFRVVAALALVFGVASYAQIPQILNFQGRVAVGGVNFNGTGKFKFALISPDGSQTYWSNDGTSVGGSAPTNAVSLPIANGLYNAALGDATLANMTPVPLSVFSNPAVSLRVWFDDGAHGSQQLSPDQRIASVAYAMIAATVPNGAITGAQIAPASVGSTQLAPNAVQTANLAAGAVGSTQIAANAVQTANIAAGAVGSAQIAVGANSASTQTAMMWDNFDGPGGVPPSGPLIGRVAPTGQTWSYCNGASTGGATLGPAGVQTLANATTYNDVPMGVPVVNCGMFATFTDSSNAAVMLVVSGNNIGADPFFHITASFNEVQLQICDNLNVTATTTATITTGSPAITVASANGISVGQLIGAAGVTPGARVASISGNTLMMNQSSTASGSEVVCVAGGLITVGRAVYNTAGFGGQCGFQFDLSADGNTVGLSYPAGYLSGYSPTGFFANAPAAFTHVQYEITIGDASNSATIQNVWINASNPNIPGATVMPWIPDLIGLNAALKAVYTGGGFTVLQPQHLGAGDVTIAPPASGNGLSIGAAMNIGRGTYPNQTTSIYTPLGAPLQLATYTVANLPVSPGIGATAVVTDATAVSYGSTAVGGGTNVVPVFFNGTEWIEH